MSLTAGLITLLSVGPTTASLSVAAATGGTGPYTYQWYRSTTTGFSPGAGNILAGATALTLNDTGLTPGTQYYYVNVVTDTGNSNVTANSTQVGAVTQGPQISINAAQQYPLLGMLDLRYNTDTAAVQVDASQATALVFGQAVKMAAVSTNLSGPPKVVACASDTDVVLGFINFDSKSQSFPALSMCEISMAGNVMYLYSTGAITRGNQVCLDLTTIGGVSATGSSHEVVGWAFDGCAAGGTLIRVYIKTPTFATA